MAAATLTVYPEAASDDDGRLAIGGCDAVELAREFGTPAYVVAEDDLRARAREFAGAMGHHHGERSIVAFASKAFPCTAALTLFREEGLAVDVASGGELHLARRAGYGLAEIVMHGNAKSITELRNALGATIVLDNLDEIDRLAPLLASGAPQRVMLRITPGVQTDTHAAVATGQAESKFGFSLEDAPTAIERLRTLAQIELAGLHLHIGSQLFDPEPYRQAIAALGRLGDFPAYDLGGGFGVPYTRGGRRLSASDQIGAMVEAAHEHLGAEAKTLTIEPGRALTAAAGVTLYTVESVKRNVVTWVAVDGGMSDNLRPMLYGSPYTADVADRLGSAEEPGELCHLAGKHCESGDVIARDVRLRAPRAGDVIATPVTGAYGHALANNYNGVPRPPVIFCSGGSARVVVRRETFEDLHARDV
ncbi:MAG: diaminopimelate decarboxylase [Solirubrobacterales bacterium]|nr:diaminopimelate decarboxylase [Solirubrobacterales bacterium]